jgi:hypothetical protein
MTATTTAIGTRRAAGAIAFIRRLARPGGSIMTAIGSRLNDVVDAGQFGPSGDIVISRHTGSRI